MTDVPFIDAHLHLWDRGVFDYPWLDGAEGMPYTFDAESVPAGEGGREGIVFIQADCVPAEGIAEAAWAAEQLSRLPGRSAVVGFAPVESTSLAEWLDDLNPIGAVVGIRRLLQDEPRELLESAELTSGLRLLGRRNLSFDACVRHWQIPELTALAGRASETTIILDHLGKPPVRAGWRSEAADAWRASLGELAALRSTYVKLSGLALEVGDGEFAPQVRPFVEATIELFGSSRVMTGSDFPVSAAPANAPGYFEWFALVESLGASPTEVDDLLRGSAARVYFAA